LIEQSAEKPPRLSEGVVIQFFDHESAEAGMRGAFVDQGGLFSYIAPEARVPSNHPLRKIRILVRDVLGELNRILGKLYASEGRPSIPPEQLLSALLLQDGAVELQSVVPLVRGAFARRPDLGPDYFHKEPRCMLDPRQRAPI
jgi:hypothetical protein